MKSSIVYRALGIIYVLLDAFFQIDMLFLIPGNQWIDNASMNNIFLLYCLAQASFGEIPILNLLFAVASLLTVVLTVIGYFAILLKKNRLLSVPLIITIVNLVFHVVLYWSRPVAYIGLAYKTISCIFLGHILYGVYRQA